MLAIPGLHPILGCYKASGVVSVYGSTDFGKMEMRAPFLLDGNLTVETKRRG